MSQASGSSCDAVAGHCITCSDEATPMRVTGVGADTATCTDDAGATHEVAIDLVGALSPGATILVHAGVAIGLAP